MRAVLLGPVLDSKLEAKKALGAVGLEKGDMRVGVDGGAAFFMQLGLVPHIAVGDWDSLKNQSLLKRMPHITLPQGKDQSDLFYAARAAINLGATEIICAGVTGGRLDQQLGVFYDLAEIAAGSAGKVKSVSAISVKLECHFLSGKIPSWRSDVTLGQTISIFALGGNAKGVTVSGLKYPLKKATLTPSSRGLSNRAVKSRVEVKIKQGSIVVMLPSRSDDSRSYPRLK